MLWSAKVNGKDVDEYWQSYSENPRAVLRSVTPQLTDTAARFYSESLPLIKGSDGSQYRAYRDPDGIVQLLDAPKGVTHVFGKE
jgi:hypothetical protein